MQRLFKDEPFVNLRLLKSVEVNYSFDLVSLDSKHVTMLSGNKKYIVVLIDHFMQWIEVGILTIKMSHIIINFIKHEILMRHGCLSRIKTDGGKP